MAEAENPLLRILLNGKLVAEANIIVHDGPVAWEGFLEAFPNIAPVVVGELFNAVRVACDPVLRQRMGPQGITIDLKKGPQIAIPEPLNLNGKR